MSTSQLNNEIILLEGTKEYNLYQAVTLLADFFDLDNKTVICAIALVAKKEKSEEWNKLFITKNN